MVDPLGDEAAGFVDRGLRVVDPVKCSTGLERGHIVRADLTQFTIRSDHGAFAPAGDEAFLRHP
jgi:hypothetical protein